MYHNSAPHPALADSINCFWTITRSLPENNPVFEVLPDGYAELVFTFGTNFSMKKNENLIALPNPFLVGLLEGPLYLHAAGIFTVVGVRMYPWAVLSLLGTKPDENTKQLEHMGLACLKQDLSEMLTAGKESELFHRLNVFFLSRNSLPGWQHRILTQAGQTMRKEEGRISMDALVRTLRISMRTLQRVFLWSTGQTPKSVARKVRFQQIRDAIWADPGIHLTTLAHRSGFSDQAHFNREFRQFSGKTPGEFARESEIARNYLHSKSVAFLQ